MLKLSLATARALCAVQLVWLCKPAATAQSVLVPSGPEFVVNTLTDAGQFAPDVVVAADDEFMVVWSGQRSATDGHTGVHAQRINTNGVKVGEEVLVNTPRPSSDSNDHYPRIGVSGESQFVVVWQNAYDGDGDRKGVFGQRLSRAGDKLGSQFRVNEYWTGEQAIPVVAAKGDGSFVVSWLDQGRRFEFRNDLMARWFNGDGTPQTNDIEVARTDDGRPDLYDVESDPFGGTHMAWQALNRDGDGDGVFAKRYDAQRNPVGDIIQLNTVTVGNQTSVDIAFSRRGDIVAVWQGPDANQTGVYGQRFTGEWERLGTEFQVSTYTSGGQRTPQVGVSGDGSFIVVWGSEGQDGDAEGVFGQLFDAEGKREGTEFQVNTYTTGSQGDSRVDIAVAVNERGSAFIVWESQNRDGASHGIAGRLFCIEGHTGRACADPTCGSLTPGQAITVADAMVTLRNVVGLQRCALCVCDADSSGVITAKDALIVLRASLMSSEPLNCPSCPSQ